MKEFNNFLKKIFSLFVAIVICGASITMYAQAPSARISGLTTTVTPASYQTWVELTNSSTPPPLNVVLGITVDAALYAGDGTIELPLNYTPTLTTHPTFIYGTDGAGTLEPFFIL